MGTTVFLINLIVSRGEARHHKIFLGFHTPLLYVCAHVGSVWLDAYAWLWRSEDNLVCVSLFRDHTL